MVNPVLDKPAPTPDHVFALDDDGDVQAWCDRNELVSVEELKDGEILKCGTWIAGPKKWAVRIGGETQWFDTESVAKEAVGLPAHDLFEEK